MTAMLAAGPTSAIVQLGVRKAAVLLIQLGKDRAAQVMSHLSDAEVEAERAAQQAADLAARLQELELQGVEGDPAERSRRRDPVDDEILLRLKVYRSLGIELERDGRDGDFNKAVVRNDRKGDVHVVNMDKKFSRFFYANYFWQTL